MRRLVIIPTYNEKENIEALLEVIQEQIPDLEVLVVDDNSPDGTAQTVRRLAASGTGRYLLERERKEGLGRAYLAGFEWGLERGYDVMVQMDADFSHRVRDLKKLLEALETDCDFVVGSRWVNGGQTVNWGLGRRCLSRGGSFYARCLLGYPINDWTGGFNAWKRHVLQTLDRDQIHSDGYSFQIELKYRALQNGFRGKEVPIVFEDRRVGSSKMSHHIMLEALLRVWKMRRT